MTGPASPWAPPRSAPAEGARRRLRLTVRGAVQGVGFRPHVYRAATEAGLAGWVANDPRGVSLEVEGVPPALEAFRRRLVAEAPPLAVIHDVEATWLEPAGPGEGGVEEAVAAFHIRPSDAAGERTAVVLPDAATCPECLAEVLDPGQRRHGYPFTNCTHCGPRFTIVRALPYDRPNTTMAAFPLCPECRREYEDPADRRFHAQPVACPECGPQLALWGPDGAILPGDPLEGAAAALGRGEIVALKGLGGFQLLADATNAAAVARLRRRKHREEKPFALMVADLAAVRALCRVPPEAEVVLSSPAAPIVLLERRLPARGASALEPSGTGGAWPGPEGAAADGAGTAGWPTLDGASGGTRSAAPEAGAEPIGEVAPEVAPGNPWLGLMLPTTPLHHLLLRRLAVPVVATSGNRSDEPIATDETDALERLVGMADLFLVHDRPIERHADDSVVRLVLGKPRLLRRARGYAPLPVLLPRPVPSIVAVGGHLKNTVALAVEESVYLSQHLGDMDTPETLAAFGRAVADLVDLYEARPAAVAHDLHPDYASTLGARVIAARLGGEDGRGPLPLVAVQHHHAHLAACLADAGEPLDRPALGVTWDGTGHGSDGTVWGGELLLGDAASFRRVGRLRPFRLPGGEAAVREPRRSALALLWELLGSEALERRDLPPVEAFSPAELRTLGGMLARGFGAPVTTSAGRLFDGVSALLGLRQRVGFEGQAAMALEHQAWSGGAGGAYRLEVTGDPEDPDGGLELDWRPVLHELLADRAAGVEPAVIALRFHRALARGIAEAAERVREERVALTGGCFQNRLLAEETAAALRRAGHRVLLHRRVPPNDGGLSLGQVVVAAARLEGIGERTRPCA
ncbi:MAG: carbamoyltransferase HypF [Thermoanaerobaculia bacterium]